MHCNFLGPFAGKVKVASWNVEGLTDIKLYEVRAFMQRNGISITWIQETRVMSTPHYTENGFLVILSGSASGNRENAGVAFVIAHWKKRAVIGFSSFRAESLVSRYVFPGGKLALFSAYVPHSGYYCDYRFAFFKQLGRFMKELPSVGQN